jgi:hypothetical protein
MRTDQTLPDAVIVGAGPNGAFTRPCASASTAARSASASMRCQATCPTPSAACWRTTAASASDGSLSRAITRCSSVSSGASSHTPMNGTPACAATRSTSRRSCPRAGTPGTRAARPALRRPPWPEMPIENGIGVSGQAAAPQIHQEKHEIAHDVDAGDVVVDSTPSNTVGTPSSRTMLRRCRSPWHSRTNPASRRRSSRRSWRSFAAPHLRACRHQLSRLSSRTVVDQRRVTGGGPWLLKETVCVSRLEQTCPPRAATLRAMRVIA